MIGPNAKLLRGNVEKVMALWTERSLKEVPSAVSADALALRDSLPIYLNHLCEALATNRKMDMKSVLAHDKESVRIGKLHGADRAGNTSYILTEVISEYHILREVIFQVLEEGGTPLTALQRDIVLDSIEQAVNDAAVKFTEVHADIQQKFVDTLTHDLKTPLTSAKMAAQMVLRRPEEADACVRSAGNILVSVNRMESMIHDLLDASRIRAGEELTVTLAKCDLKPIIHDVVDEMILSYGNRFQIDSTEGIEIDCSADLIRRALENLIGNAVKYGSENSLITVSAIRAISGAVEVSVHNIGSFIPESELPTLFQHFGRSQGAKDGKKPGWGLGLTLVRGVVSAHKGKLRVESSRESGTKFVLELPGLMAA